MDYKKYSLENLENWMHDAISSGDATPQEIYDVIVGVVKETYYYHKDKTSEAYELLALLNGHGKGHIKEYDDCVDKILSCDKDDPSPECQSAWNNFWEDSMQPWGHSDLEYNIREAEYYNKKNELEVKENTQEFYKNELKKIEEEGGYEWTPAISKQEKKSKYYYEYDRNDLNRKNPFEDRVVKWQLPVQQKIEEGIDDYYVQFPDDLLEAANLKEGDQVEWVDNGDSSYTLKKV